MVRMFLTVFLMIVPKKGVAQDIVNICNHVNRQNKIPLKITGSSINVTSPCSCLVQSDGINVTVDSVQLYGSQQNISRLTIMDVNLYVFPEEGSSMAVDGEFIVYNRSNGLRSFQMDSFIIIWNPVSGIKSSTFDVILSANSSSYFDMRCIKHEKFPWSAWLDPNKIKILPSMNGGENTKKESLDGVVDIVNICNHVNRQNKIPLKITGSSINVTSACSCLVQSDGINVTVDSVQLYGSQQNISRLTIMDVNLYVFPEEGSSMAVDGEFIVYNRSNGLRSFQMDSFIIIWNPVSGIKSSTFDVILSANSSSYFDMRCIKHEKFPWSAWLDPNKIKILPSMNGGENTRKESLDGVVVAGAFIGGLVLGLLLIAGAGLGYRYWKCGETPSPVRSALKRLSLTKSAEKIKDYGRLGESIDHRGIDRANKSVSCRTTKNVTLYSPESPPVIQIQEKAAPNGQRRGKSTRNPNMPVEIRNLALYRNVSEENLVEEDRIQYREGNMVGSGKKEQSKPTHNEDSDVLDNVSSSMGTEEEDIEQSTANVRATELTGSRLQIDYCQEQEELTVEGVSPCEQDCEQRTNEIKHDQNHLMSKREGAEPQENSDDGDFHFTTPLNISASEGLEQIPSQHDTNKNQIVLKSSDSVACYDNKGLDDD